MVRISSRSLAILVAAMIPSLLGLLLAPTLILDDLQFARIARFEGFRGFLDEMAYRPGQGLIHGVQFVVLGEHAAAHLILLAGLSASVAFAFDHLARRWLSPSLATAATIAWLVLPNRGSTRFWAATVPNHVALLLMLAAAALLVPAPRSQSTRRWIGAVAALIAAVLTYEAVAAMAAVVVVLPLAWNRSKSELAKSAAALACLTVTSLFVLLRSPRAEASGFLPAPLHGLSEMVTSIGPPILGSFGWLVAVALALWLVVDRSPELSESRRVAAVGVVLAMLGLAPFLVAGFNINDIGVLDRSLFFADLGLALLLAPALAHLHQHSFVGRATALTFAAALAVGTVADLNPFAQTWDDQASARQAFTGWEKPAGDGVVLVDLPLHSGIGWAHYRVQVTDLYQLANNDDHYPDWLGFHLSSADIRTDETPVIIVDGAVVPLTVE